MYTPCVDEGICVAVTQTTVKQKKQKKLSQISKKFKKDELKIYTKQMMFKRKFTIKKT